MSYEDVVNYTDATCHFYHSGYSDDFRMRKFAEANKHVTDNDIISAIEQELYDFDSNKLAIAGDMHLEEVERFVQLLKYRHKQRMSLKFAVNE